MLMVGTCITASLSLVEHINRLQHSQMMFGGWIKLAKHQIQNYQYTVEQTAELLNLPLNVQPLDESSLNFIERQRLRLGQIIILNDLGETSVYSRLGGEGEKGEGQVLWFKIKTLGSEHLQGVYALMDLNLKRDSKNFIQYVEQLQADHGFPLLIKTEEEMGVYETGNMTVPNFKTEYKFDDLGPNFISFLPDQNKYVEIGPIEFHSHFSMQSILVSLVFAVILAGISVYWLVQKFEIGLQRLERASSRVASGHLNSRVKVSTQDSIGRLGLAFNRMAEQIQRLMGIQKEMIRAVSHELRTPVARMRFGVQMLEDTVEDGYVQKQLGDMDQDLQELDELVDEILTYARLEEGGPILEFKPANMLELIQQIQDETKRRTDKVTVSCHSEHSDEQEIFCEIEFRYMHRAVQNLVGNACRYAKEKVHIEYSFKDDICRIDVEDDGDGIPEKDWDRVFSPFTRLDDSRTRASGGYGLGLSIVRRIIYWHEGRAQVSESRWGGAKMSLIWPKRMH